MLKTFHLKTIVPFLFLLLTFASCKKYEEGPVTLRTPKNRLTDKDWVLSEKIVNNVKVTLDDDDKSSYVTYEDDGKVNYTVGGISISGTWKFSDDKETIISSFSFMGTSVSDEATILKLTNDELWLKTTEGIITTEEHYTKK